MEASKMTIDINVKDIDLFKNLVSLLERHFDDLPEQLQNSLKDILDDNIDEIEAFDGGYYINSDLTDFFLNVDTKFIDTDFKTTEIINVCGELKKVEYFDEKKRSRDIDYPEHFYLKYDGKTIIEW